MEDAQAVQERHERNTRMNVLLYIGSFFIAGSMLLLAKDAPDIMPVILILVTLLVYGAGLILYRTVDYLQPVATAFTYTGLILFPIWYYAFESAGLPSQTALMISSIFACISSIGATIVVESRIAGWLGYIWLIISGWAFGAFIEKTTGSTPASAYSFFIWPLIVAIFPNICWSFRVKWLPLAFRSATKALAEIIVPAAVVMVAFTLAAPNIGQDMPALRAITGALAALNALISLIAKKNRGKLTALRFYTQFFIVALFADILNYSLFANLFNHSQNGTAIAMAIVWLATFLVQMIISLFIPQRNDDERRYEHGSIIASLVGIFSTSLFCVSFDATSRGIFMIALAAAIATLGILISFRYRDIRWSAATILGCLYIPLELGLDLATPIWSGWTFFAIYSVLTLIAILVYAFITAATEEGQSHKRALLTVAIIAGNLIGILATASETWPEAGWLVAAVDVALAAALTKRYNWLEASAYLAALSLFSLIGNLMSRGHYYDLEDPTSLALNAIRVHILALPLLAFGFVKERGQSSPARLVFGYLIYTLPMFAIASFASDDHNYLWPIIFILEQVAFLVAGLFAKRKWMTVCGIVLSIIATLELTGGLSSVWLLFIGIGLMAFVGYQLAKSNKKQ